MLGSEVRHSLFCDHLWRLRAEIMRGQALSRIPDEPTAVKAIMNNQTVSTKAHGISVVSEQLREIEAIIFAEIANQPDPYAYLFRPSFDIRMIYHKGRALGYSGRQINPATGVNDMTIDLAIKFAQRKVNGQSN